GRSSLGACARRSEVSDEHFRHGAACRGKAERRAVCSGDVAKREEGRGVGQRFLALSTLRISSSTIGFLNALKGVIHPGGVKVIFLPSLLGVRSERVTRGGLMNVDELTFIILSSRTISSTPLSLKIR